VTAGGGSGNLFWYGNVLWDTGAFGQAWVAYPVFDAYMEYFTRALDALVMQMKLTSTLMAKARSGTLPLLFNVPLTCDLRPLLSLEDLLSWPGSEAARPRDAGCVRPPGTLHASGLAVHGLAVRIVHITRSGGTAQWGASKSWASVEHL
jgi:hypothetical protein